MQKDFELAERIFYDLAEIDVNENAYEDKKPNEPHFLYDIGDYTTDTTTT